MGQRNTGLVENVVSLLALFHALLRNFRLLILVDGIILLGLSLKLIDLLFFRTKFWKSSKYKLF